VKPLTAQGRVCERCGNIYICAQPKVLCAPCHNGAPAEYRGPLGPAMLGLVLGSG
jgi:hypothetical protein